MANSREITKLAWEASDEVYRYAAFISYRHVEPDRTWAKWLHAALETYRVPRKLVTQTAVYGRIGRVFRDEEELPASANLKDDIEFALTQSRFLIVVCSPRTPQSLWVNKEVERFREMGRNQNILALLIEGEPAQSFPTALREIRRTVIDDGLQRQQIEEVEPLAADVREHAGQSVSERRRHAKLRLLAALLGVTFDDLRQREQERRTRRLRWLSATATLLVMVMATLTAFAWVQRRAAVANAERATAGEQQAAHLADEKGKLADILRHTLSETDARIGRLMMEQGRDDEALPYEARALEEDSSNQAAVTDSVALLYRSRTPSVLLRHDQAVSSAAFSPDGMRVLTASLDNTARLWDASTGKPLGEPMRHWRAVFSAVFSPDGTRVVTASADNTARVWDAASGKPLGEPMRHGDYVNSAAFSPDGTRVVTASNDKTARVWDAASGKPLGEPMPHEDRVDSAAFSSDGTRVVTASADQTAQIWDADSGKPLGKPMRHGSGVYSAAFSPDGTRVVTASYDHTAQVWDAASGRPLGKAMWHESGLNSAAFSPDGTRVVTTGKDKTARVWDAASGKPLGEPMRHDHFVNFAAFSPDGTRVVTASGDALLEKGDARVWDAASSKPLGEPMRHERWVSSAAFSPDGTRVVTASVDKAARVWNTASGKPLRTPMQHGAEVYSAAFSPDGTRVITGRFRGEKGVAWDAASGKPLGEPMSHEHWAAAFSSDGMRWVTTSEDDTAQVLDAASGKPLGEPMRHAGRVTSAAFSPDGKRVVTASLDKTARVWDAVSGKPLGKPMQHGSGVHFAVFSPDGTRVVTASGDLPWEKKDARVWDAASGEPLGEPMWHEGEVTSALFSPDGVRVVTASVDKTAQVWDAASGKPLGEPMRHEARVNSAAFSPDGTRVVTASWDNTARVWDAASGKPLGEPLPHQAEVTTAAFSPDGTRVVTASKDWTARVWDVAIPAPAGSAFLAQLDQLAANRRLASGGFAEPLPDWMALHDSLKRQAEMTARTQPSARWMNWFLADPRHRTISPFSTLSVDEWIENRLGENTAEGMQSVWEIDPNNSRCLSRRARRVIRETPEAYAAAAPIYVELYSRRAAELAPKDAEVLWRRAAMLAWFGRSAEAMKLAADCPAPGKDDVWAWEAKWEACMMLKRDADAQTTLAVVAELARIRTGYIRASLERNISEVQSLPPRGATTRPATAPQAPQ